MIKSNYSVQLHYGKRPGTHWDFRVYDPKSKRVLSWAIPKQRFPQQGEKVYAAWVDDTHDISYMDYDGRLPNGDRVKLQDVGKIDIHKLTNDRMIFDLNGKNNQGNFILIKTSKNNWLIIGKR